MSVTYIPTALRNSVYERAQGLCEYCLIEEEISFAKQVYRLNAKRESDDSAFANQQCGANRGTENLKKRMINLKCIKLTKKIKSLN